MSRVIRLSAADPNATARVAKSSPPVPSLGKMPFEEVEPWHEPVDPSEVLDRVCAAMHLHIVADKEALHAATLWTVMTYLTDLFDVAPLLVITAPEMRCGKSEFRRLIGRMVYRPIHADNMTPAVLFRCFDLWQPTLLVDEYDTFVKGNDELRGIFNAGHQRGGCVWRCVGDDFVPTAFNVYGAKVLAGIGSLPSTLADRSIILPLRRKLSTEVVVPQRSVPHEDFRQTQSLLARMALDYADEIRAARPVLPEGLSDRAHDNWEPLFQIAHIGGDFWLQAAHDAALKLSRNEEETKTVGVALLTDIQEAFATKKVDRFSSSEIITILCDDDEKRWATYNRGFPITPTQVAKRLREYGISSKTIRVNGTTLKGYVLPQFEDAFARYVFADQPGSTSAVTPPPVKEAEPSSATPPLRATPTDVTRGANSDGGCGSVASETPEGSSSTAAGELSGDPPAVTRNTDVTPSSNADLGGDGVTADDGEGCGLHRTLNQDRVYTEFVALLVQDRLNNLLDEHGEMSFDSARPLRPDGLRLEFVAEQVKDRLHSVDRQRRLVTARQIFRQLIERRDLVLNGELLTLPRD